MLNYDRVMIGQNIRDIRIKKGYSVRELCDAIDISEDHLKKIESGGRSMSIEVLFKIMDALELDANTVLSIISTDEGKNVRKGKSVDRMLDGIEDDTVRGYLEDVIEEMISRVPDSSFTKKNDKRF